MIVLLPFPDDTNPADARAVCKDLENLHPNVLFYALIGTSLTSAVVLP